MTPQGKERKPRMKGPLAWMASNSVAANLLMFFLIFGGLFYFPRIKQEVFPQFELDLVLVNVIYPGASPAEIEQGLILAVEEAVRSVDGVKEIRSTANESVGVVAVEHTLLRRALRDSVMWAGQGVRQRSVRHGSQRKQRGAYDNSCVVARASRPERNIMTS